MAEHKRYFDDTVAQMMSYITYQSAQSNSDMNIISNKYKICGVMLVLGQFK